MAREKDVFDTIEMQAKHVIGLIEDEMAELRERLGKLEDQHARWSAILAGSTPGRAGHKQSPAGRGTRSASAPQIRRERAPKRAPRSSPPVDWDEALRALPDEFSMVDVAAATPNLSENPRARIVAIARWARAKQVHKIGDGRYAKGTERARKRAAAAQALARPSPPSHDGEESHADEGGLPAGEAAGGGSTAA